MLAMLLLLGTIAIILSLLSNCYCTEGNRGFSTIWLSRRRSCNSKVVLSTLTSSIHLVGVVGQKSIYCLRTMSLDQRKKIISWSAKFFCKRKMIVGRIGFSIRKCPSSLVNRFYFVEVYWYYGVQIFHFGKNLDIKLFMTVCHFCKTIWVMWCNVSHQ